MKILSKEEELEIRERLSQLLLLAISQERVANIDSSKTEKDIKEDIKENAMEINRLKDKK